MKNLFLFLAFTVAVDAQTFRMRDETPPLRVLDWTVGSSTTITFHSEHNLSTNDHVYCYGVQTQPNLNGDFQVASIPSPTSIVLKTLAGDSVQTFNSKSLVYNYNGDQDRTPPYKASCGRTTEVSLNDGPLGMIPPVGSPEYDWIRDPDGTGPLSAPAMSGPLGQYVTANAGTYSSNGTTEPCNPDIPISTSNCKKEYLSDSEISMGTRPLTVALAWFMNQQNTRWKNSALAYIKNLEKLTPQFGRFTAADTISTHANRGQITDFTKMYMRYWSMHYALMESALSESEQTAVRQKFYNDDSVGCENILPDPTGEASTVTGKLRIDNVSGWQVGDWGYVRSLQRKFKRSDSTITAPIVVSGGTATAILSGPHTTATHIKVSGSGVTDLDGTRTATGTTTITFAAAGVPDGTYDNEDLEIFSYGSIPGGQGTFFQVTNIAGSDLTITPAVTNALNSPYSKLRTWNSNSCGMYWLTRHHDSSVPLDQKSYVRVQVPVSTTDTTLTVPAAYAGILRQWTAPFTLVVGAEQMLASAVDVPDDDTSPATITISQRGYNNTPAVSISSAATAVLVTTSGRTFGEAATSDNMWISSSFQNLRSTDLGGTISSAFVFARHSPYILNRLKHTYNVYRDQHLEWAKTHWSGNTSAGTNPGYHIGRQVEMNMSPLLSAVNSISKPEIVQPLIDGAWKDDINTWFMFSMQPYNPRYRLMVSDSGTGRFVDHRHMLPGYMNRLAPGQKYHWGNFFKKYITGSGFQFTGANNRTLSFEVMYNSLTSPTDDYRTSSPRGAVWVPTDAVARSKGYGMNQFNSRTDWNSPRSTAYWMYALAPNGDHLGEYNPPGAYQIAKLAEAICPGTVGCVSSLRQSGMRIFTAATMPTISSGSNSTKAVKILLPSPAPSGGALVSLTTDDPSVRLPARVTVPAEDTEATVQAIAYIYSGKQTANVTATSANTKTAYLTTPNQYYPAAQVAATIASISFNSTTFAAGTSVVGTVTLTAPATGGGTDVTVTGSSGILVSGPVRVRTGMTTSTFHVSAEAGTGFTGTVTASSANSIISQTLTVITANPTTVPITAIITGIDSLSPGSQTLGLRTYQVGGVTTRVSKYGVGEDYTFWQLIPQSSRNYGGYADGAIEYYQRSFYHDNEFGKQDYAIIHNIVRGSNDPADDPGRERVEKITFYRGNSLGETAEKVIASSTQTRTGSDVTFIKPDTSATLAGGVAIATKILLPGPDSIVDNFNSINTSTSYGADVEIYLGNGRETSESLWIHKVVEGASVSQPNASLVSVIDSNSTGILIDETPSRVITFPKSETPLTATSFTVNPSNAGYARLTGYAGGTYTVTRNGSALGLFCVTEPDSVLKFNIPSGNGAYVVSRSSTAECNPALWWVTKSLPSQESNTTFEMNMTALGGAGSKSYSLVSGSLPTGVTMNTAGKIQGATAQTGSFPITVRATDESSTKDELLTLVITSGSGALSVSTGSLASGYEGTAYSATLSGAGGQVPYVWSISTGDLPAGLSMSSAGVISGAPTTAGVYNFTVQLDDSLEDSTTKAFTIIILEPAGTLSISTAAIPDGTAGTPFNFQLSGNGGSTPYTWSIQSGSLPTGLTLSSSGLISGTASVSGTTSATYQVLDALSNTATKLLNLTIQENEPTPPGTIQVSAVAAGTAGIVTLRKPGLDVATSCTVDVYNGLNQLVDSVIASTGLAVRTVAVSGLVGGGQFRSAVTCGEDTGTVDFTSEIVTGNRDVKLTFPAVGCVSGVTVEFGPSGNMNQSITTPCVSGCDVTIPNVPKGTVLDVRHTLQRPSSIRKVLVR